MLIDKLILVIIMSWSFNFIILIEIHYKVAFFDNIISESGNNQVYAVNMPQE